MRIKTLSSAALLATTLLIAPASAEDLQFTLINDTDTPIAGFFVSPASSDSWEDNLMDGGYLDAGYETEVLIEDGLSTCAYDIRASFTDGETLEDYGLDLCDLGSYTFE
ncbi:hypothetical protein [Roseibium sp. SCP14]|uniref:hypothetical protein n=1 Tax=Roseibium sp. SCP14 TaxID=3141375 RepID=UPI003334E1D6